MPITYEEELARAKASYDAAVAEITEDYADRLKSSLEGAKEDYERDLKRLKMTFEALPALKLRLETELGLSEHPRKESVWKEAEHYGWDTVEVEKIYRRLVDRWLK